MYQTFLKVVGTVKLHEAKLGGGNGAACALTLASRPTSTASCHGLNPFASFKSVTGHARNHLSSARGHSSPIIWSGQKNASRRDGATNAALTVLAAAALKSKRLRPVVRPRVAN